MPKIHVVQPFTLNTTKGQKRFEVGEQEVSKEEAEHWYTQAHIQQPKKAEKTQEKQQDPPPPAK